jgi:hypothetical protein
MRQQPNSNHQARVEFYRMCTGPALPCVHFVNVRLWNWINGPAIPGLCVLIVYMWGTTARCAQYISFFGNLPTSTLKEQRLLKWSKQKEIDLICNVSCNGEREDVRKSDLWWGWGIGLYNRMWSGRCLGSNPSSAYPKLSDLSKLFIYLLEPHFSLV